MSKPSPALQACWLIIAVLQLVLPGAAALADAQLDAAGAHAKAHIESHTTSACARIHAPDCALCQFLTAPVTPGRPNPFRFARAADRAYDLAAPPAPPRSFARLHPPPRAPPALS